LRSASLYIDIEPDFKTKEIELEFKEELFLEEVEANSLLSSLVNLVINIEDKRFLKVFDLMQNFYKIEPLLPSNNYTPIDILSIEIEINSIREELYNLVLLSKASKSALKNFEPAEVKALFQKKVFEKPSLLEHKYYKKHVEKNPQIDILYLELKDKLKEWARAKEQTILYNLFKLFDYYKNANISTAKRLGVLSFDDLSYFTYRLLYESISKEFLYFKIDSHFKHILLDEFQDTSTLQFLLLKPLIDEIFAGSYEFRSFFYVGDKKQSLYRFRGGVEELFDKVAQKYGIDIAHLDTNYRSSRHIVEQVNRWFKPIMQDYFLQKPHENSIDGYVEVIESDELIDMTLSKIEWLISMGVDISNIAVLVSTNRDGAVIQEVCYEKGIQTRLKTSSSLKYIPKVVSIVSMIEYLLEKNKIDAIAILQKVDKSIEDIDLSWFNTFMQPIEVIDRLIVQFGYFQDDLNLLKLLEFASEFSNLFDFVEEFKLSNIDVASHSKEGVMIMTIHGSKGLEFEHVIVLDRLKGPAPNRDIILYDYDESLHIKDIFYKIGRRELFDREYEIIIEKQKTLSRKDKLNLLYVALTRAVESMIIIKKTKGSIFDDINMETITLGNFSHKGNKTIEKKENQNREIIIEYYGTQDIDRSLKDEEELDYKSVLFGLALHYTLEIISSFSKESLTQAIIATENRYGLELKREQLIDIESRVLELISNKRFQNLLKGADISKEQSISFNGELKQIDLLLTYGDKNIVIDYKSSKANHIRHIAQVREYQNIIEQITQKETKGIIIYLLRNGIEFFELK
jgi:exodeoxyribonuclease V beta subunit